MSETVNGSQPSPWSDAALLSRSHAVARAIALDVLANEPGERLLPISAYSKDLDVGTGTVQTALAHLQRIGAFSLDAQGRRGTVIRERDLARLWYVATGRPVIGGHALPFTRIFEGLEAGIRECFRRIELTIALLHVDGSRRRIDVLCEGESDFAVVSRLGSEIAIQEGIAIETVCRLGRGSYMHEHTVLRGASFPTNRSIRAGTDPSSLEHRLITQIYCEGFGTRHTFDYVDTPPSEFARRFSDGALDVIVWPSDETMPQRPPSAVQEPLPGHVLESLQRRHLEASVVVRSGDKAARALVSRIVDPALVRKVQAQVIRGLRVASV